MDVFGSKQPRFCNNYTITANGNRADSDFNSNRAVSSLDAECQKLLQQTKDDIEPNNDIHASNGAISDVDENPIVQDVDEELGSSPTTSVRDPVELCKVDRNMSSDEKTDHPKSSIDCLVDGHATPGELLT
ncbi:hypothetical protein R3W88_015633 [Solanum pinnatisectum]|uniref:Uncharacterized protein n=1 Tax=Solanum pinnatisectum TaxID=50273 RepID=A0AAV9KV11_9SOLN|nr:hypothetical protein R3W88_015633 [Solanum pinnatisectum]